MPRIDLPGFRSDYLQIETLDDRIARVRLARPEKRNAIRDDVLREIETIWSALPEHADVVVLSSIGDHFCAGLDLAEHVERTPEAALHHSRWWHGVLEKVQFSGLPVVSALRGAVIGGGLEIASATHVRVADRTAFYELPEGRRGIFVGGGATVRVARIMGHDRMTEMMLTGRRLSAEEGQALGLSHYLVDDADKEALRLAKEIGANARLSNYFAIHSIAHAADTGAANGYFTESLSVALAQTSTDARSGISAFLTRKQTKT